MKVFFIKVLNIPGFARYLFLIESNESFNISQIFDIPRDCVTFDNIVTLLRLSYFPHKLDNFTALLKEAFGPRAKHTVYADFKPLHEEPEPSFYIHVIEKPLY